MSPWYGTRPTGSDAIRDLPEHMKANWTYMHQALSAEHTFPGSWPGSGSTAGHHKRSATSIIATRPASTYITDITSPPCGALVWVRDQYRLRYYNHDNTWHTFPLVHPVSGFMTGNLDYRGSLIDGRDISVDGTKLDTITDSANTMGVSMSMVISAGTGTYPTPNTPTGIDPRYTTTETIFICTPKWQDYPASGCIIEDDGDYRITGDCNCQMMSIGVR